MTFNISTAPRVACFGSFAFLVCVLAATPAVQPGVEAFLRAEYTSPTVTPRPFDLEPHVYVGPTLLGQFGRLWWAAGAYARLTERSHTLAAGDAYGNYWVRSVLGYEL